jgi:hypothetical protein
MFIKYEIIGQNHIMILNQLKEIKGIGSSKEMAFNDLLKSISFYIDELKQVKNVNFRNISEYKKINI